MFCLLLMDDGSYQICDEKHITRRTKNTCRVVLDSELLRKGRLMACNESYSMLHGIQIILNSGSPSVRMEQLKKTEDSSFLDTTMNSVLLEQESDVKESEIEATMISNSRSPLTKANDKDLSLLDTATKKVQAEELKEHEVETATIFISGSQFAKDEQRDEDSSLLDMTANEAQSIKGINETQVEAVKIFSSECPSEKDEQTTSNAALSLLDTAAKKIQSEKLKELKEVATISASEFPSVNDEKTSGNNDTSLFNSIENKFQFEEDAKEKEEEAHTILNSGSQSVGNKQITSSRDMSLLETTAKEVHSQEIKGSEIQAPMMLNLESSPSIIEPLANNEDLSFLDSATKKVLFEKLIESNVEPAAKQKLMENISVSSHDRPSIESDALEMKSIDNIENDILALLNNHHPDINESQQGLPNSFLTESIEYVSLDKINPESNCFNNTNENETKKIVSGMWDLARSIKQEKILKNQQKPTITCNSRLKTPIKVVQRKKKSDSRKNTVVETITTALIHSENTDNIESTEDRSDLYVDKASSRFRNVNMRDREKKIKNTASEKINDMLNENSYEDAEDNNEKLNFERKRKSLRSNNYIKKSSVVQTLQPSKSKRHSLTDEVNTKLRNVNMRKREKKSTNPASNKVNDVLSENSFEDADVNENIILRSKTKSLRYDSEPKKSAVPMNCQDNKEEDEEDDENEGSSEYVPSEKDDSDDYLSDEYELADSNKTRLKRKVKTLEFSFTGNREGQSACDDGDMVVESSRGPAGDKKINCCFFCQKPQMKIARHLATIHKDEPQMQKILSLPKGNIQRNHELSILRKKGNFIFNTNAELNDGVKIVVRRPNRKYERSASDYVHCSVCKGSYSKSSIRFHFSKCSGINSKKHRVVMLSSKQVAGMVHAIANNTVRQYIIPTLRDDKIGRVVRYDELLITFTNKQCQRLRSEHHHKQIRQNLRMLGRLLIAVKDTNKKVTDFASIFNPEMYDDFVAGVNKVAQFNEETNSFAAPSTASMLGTLIKKIGKVQRSMCIKRKENEKLKDVENFLKLQEEDYGISVNATVAENQAEKARLKVIKIPSMEDIKKLHVYLTRERKAALARIKEKFTSRDWSILAETTMTSVQLFNRRRAGETERMKIIDFRSYKTINEKIDKDLWKELSNAYRDAARKYVRFEIRGKKCRTVAILLSSELLDCFETILKYREEAGVHDENPYVFGIPSNTLSKYKRFEACNSLRKFALACGASDPESLRGTELRKHIATKCFALDLTEQEIEQLSNFLGHSKDIHKSVYRQTLVHKQIFCMTKLLEIARGDDSEDEESNAPMKNIKRAHSELSNQSEENENSILSKHSEEDENSAVSNHIAEDAHFEHSMDTGEEEKESYEEYDSDNAVQETKTKKTIPLKKRKRSVDMHEDDQTRKKRRSSSPRGKIKRIAWTRPEKDLILSQFGSSIGSNSTKFPSLKVIGNFIAKHSVLKARTPQQVKTWLSNQKQANRRIRSS